MQREEILGKIQEIKVPQPLEQGELYLYSRVNTSQQMCKGGYFHVIKKLK